MSDAVEKPLSQQEREAHDRLQRAIGAYVNGQPAIGVAVAAYTQALTTFALQRAMIDAARARDPAYADEITRRFAAALNETATKLEQAASPIIRAAAIGPY